MRRSAQGRVSPGFDRISSCEYLAMKASPELSGLTVWFTGLPCSGKSTLADQLKNWLQHHEYKVEVLDGDVVRTLLSKGLGFSKEGRDTNILRIGFVCNLLSRNGVIAIAASISPYRSVRNEVRRMIGERFVEVYVDCPLEVCIRRDIKGLYKKALAGELKGFTGVDDPYEPPENPELVIHSGDESVENSLEKLLAFLSSRGYVTRSSV